MVGKILGGRYELIDKIGGGGMAVVYKARCRLLDRFVAVKMLRPEFTNDEEFVKRFRIEAQAAASLSHPNIVSIFDVGNEDGVHYIVMEYVDGVTLKEYISREGVLDWRETLEIAIQICSAIEHAHRNHIVHRDIKPHNILLTREGIAKVTDFGIARAVSSSTLTMVGTTIGSVHYFSPEQARGGFIDEKSDLYSLGIAMYEMVTGRVPFDGETPVAVALKHIQSQAEPPSEIDRRVPRSVNDIIMKAIEKEQGRRYQTASGMLADLYRALKEPNGRFVANGGGEDYPTRKIRSLDSENFTQKEGLIAMGQNYGKKKRKRGFAVVTAVFTSLIIMLMAAYVVYKLIIPTIVPETKDFTVENYVGRDFYKVKEELAGKGVTAKEKRVFSDSTPNDFIVSQNVEEGQKLKLGGYNIIEFEVSKGPELVKIPDLKQQDYRTAETGLRKLGLEPSVEEEFSDTVPIGLVIRTEPEAEREVKPGTAVKIFKSKGPELKQVEVPDLFGKTRDEAQKLLEGAKLVIGKVFPENVSSVVDKVIKQYPQAFAVVDEGSPVDIWFEERAAETVQGGNGQASPERMEIDKKIILDNPEKFGDKIKVKVEATPSDTKKVETVMNEIRNKDSFPVTVLIPVPKNGYTKVKVFLDNKFYAEYYVSD